jgi:hypothetical protein
LAALRRLVLRVAIQATQLRGAAGQERSTLGRPPPAGAARRHPGDAVARRCRAGAIDAWPPSGGWCCAAASRQGSASCRPCLGEPPLAGAHQALRALAQNCGAAPALSIREVRGRPCPESRRMMTSAGRMPKRRQHPSERRPGRPTRTSGDGAWAAPRRRPAPDTVATRIQHVENRVATRVRARSPRLEGTSRAGRRRKAYSFTRSR